MGSKVTLDWADDEHSFCLRLGELRELQDKTGVGPQKLMRRVAEGDWHVDDLRETLRLGLIGAGMSAPEALKLVRRYVDERPLIESIQPALAVLVAVLSGFEAASPRKKGKPAKRTTTASTSPASTEAAS